MLNIDENLLKAYAKLTVRRGANVQKGQNLTITANVRDEYFVKYLVEEAYKAGARFVRMEWYSDIYDSIRYQNEDKDSMAELRSYEEEKLKYDLKNLPARIFVESSDPDALSLADPDKIAYIQKKRGPLVKKYRKEMDGHYQWTIVGLPGEEWAKKVFPELKVNDAMNKLMEAIIHTARLSGDPLVNWQHHSDNLHKKCKLLNDLSIKNLHYTSKNGTDFRISLPKEMQFEGGSSFTVEGIEYEANIPTEECFTSPDKDTAEGVVYATKPLSVNGNVVSDFGFRFKGGKAVEVIAKTEKEKKILENLISTDEGASRLGEVALVPFDSPINETGILFYNTLYDENACCHIALGESFDECIRNYDKLSKEEKEKINLNHSVIHVDFMIGSADLKIEAETYDGKNVTIFENGTWAI